MITTEALALGVDATPEKSVYNTKRSDEAGFSAPSPETPTAGALPSDHHDKALRPKTLAQYIGQEKAREQIEVFVSAAKARAESLPRAPVRPARPR